MAFHLGSADSLERKEEESEEGTEEEENEEGLGSVNESN